MQCRNRTDEIEVRPRKVPRRRIRQLKLEILEFARPRTRDPNHLRRQIQRDYVLAKPRQFSSERARPTPDLQDVFTVQWDVAKQQIVIVVVRRPTFFIKQSQTVEI